MTITTTLYKLARTSNDIEKILSGNPDRIVKRIINKTIGKTFFGKILLGRR